MCPGRAHEVRETMLEVHFVSSCCPVRASEVEKEGWLRGSGFIGFVKYEQAPIKPYLFRLARKQSEKVSIGINRSHLPESEKVSIGIVGQQANHS